MKIIWSPLAMEQVRDVAQYIALDKVLAAEAWVENIFDSVESLLDFPKRGRMVPEIERADLREIIVQGYRVIYKLSKDQLVVLIVKDSRQKFDRREVNDS